MTERPLPKVSSGPWEADIHLQTLALSEYPGFLNVYIKHRLQEGKGYAPSLPFIKSFRGLDVPLVWL